MAENKGQDNAKEADDKAIKRDETHKDLGVPEGQGKAVKGGSYDIKKNTGV